MKKILISMLILFTVIGLSYADESSRVKKYLYDHGITNSYYESNFTLRNDEKGLYIDIWNYPTITKPTLAQCPSEGESDAWATNNPQQALVLSAKLQALVQFYTLNDGDIKNVGK